MSFHRSHPPFPPLPLLFPLEAEESIPLHPHWPGRYYRLIEVITVAYQTILMRMSALGYYNMLALEAFSLELKDVYEGLLAIVAIIFAWLFLPLCMHRNNMTLPSPLTPFLRSSPLVVASVHP